MKTKPIKPAALDYAESAAVMKSQAADAELTTLSTLFDEFESAAAATEAGAVAMANIGRELGIHLQTLCGHEQMEIEFWKTRCAGKLPEKFTLDSAKLFISIARKMPQPVKTIQEAFQFMQPALVAGDLLELPERTEAQSRANIPLFERFLGEFTMMRQPWKKIGLQMPMEQWAPTMLDKFLSETEWLAEERAKAERLKGVEA